MYLKKYSFTSNNGGRERENTILIEAKVIIKSDIKHFLQSHNINIVLLVLLDTQSRIQIEGDDVEVVVDAKTGELDNFMRNKRILHNRTRTDRHTLGT